MLDTGKVIILCGIAIVIVGFSLFIVSGLGVGEQFGSSSLLMAGETLDQTQTITVRSLINTEAELFLAINAVPPEVPLIVLFEAPNGDEVLELGFSGKLIKSVGSLEKKEYSITVINAGEKPVAVFAMLTPDNILESDEQMFSLFYYGVAGVVCFFAGMSAVIAGIAVWIIQRKHRKKTK